METTHELTHSREACKVSVMAVKDALYVLSGKWKLPLILALSTGPQRFKDIQRTLGDITPKILSKELKELETNEFVTRKVFSSRPVSVIYELTPYSRSLDKVLEELRNWGLQHRERIMHPLKVDSEESQNETSHEENISTLFQQ
jgi:DNA-binding HxlR family transcriptional regulator